MGEHHEVAKSTAVIAALTMLSRVLGMLRETVVAMVFGATAVADSYFVAITFPFTMQRLMGDGGFTISFVPIFTEELVHKGKDEAMKFAYTAFWCALTLILVVTAAGMIFTPWVVRIVAPGFGNVPGKMAIATRLTRQIFPYTIFVCIVAVAMGILNSLKHFSMPAFSPLLLSVSVIASVVILNLHYHFAANGTSLVIGVLAGGVLQVAVQLPTLWRHGFHFKPYLDLKHPGLLRTAKLMGMAIIGVMVYQLNVFIGTFFVSDFPGGRSFIYYADRLVDLPQAIFGIALGTAILPSFSRFAAKQDMHGMGDALEFGLNFLAFMIIPSVLGLILFRTPIINLIYQHGNFHSDENLSTGLAVLLLSLGVWASAGIRVVVPSYYALKDARTPVTCSAIAMAVNLAGCALLTSLPYTRDRLGFAGVCLATAFASVLNFFIHVVMLQKKLPRFLDRRIFLKVGKCLVACIPMVAISFWLCQKDMWLEPGMLVKKAVWLGAGISVSGGLYFILAWVLGVEETKKLKDILLKARNA